MSCKMEKKKNLPFRINIDGFTKSKVSRFFLLQFVKAIWFEYLSMFSHLDLMKNQHSKNSSLVRQIGSRHVGSQVDYLDKDSRLKEKYTIMLRGKFVIYIRGHLMPTIAEERDARAL